MKKERQRTRRRTALLAGILAAVLAVAAPLSARAAAPAPSSSAEDKDKGSITISNPKQGVTYLAYKIFDVSYTKTATESSYSYSIAGDSPWYTAVKTYADVAANGLTLTKAAGTNTYTASVTEGTFSAAKFAAALKDALTGKTATATKTLPADAAEDATLTMDKLPLGYYFVIGQTTKTDGGTTTTETQALCNLTTTDPAATIKDKNDTPFEKTVTKIDDITLKDPATGKDVQVGQKLTYTITGEVPDLSGAAEYYYFAKDSMTKGLTFSKDVTITIGAKGSASPAAVTPAVITDASAKLSGNQIRYTDPVAGTSGGGFELSLNLLEKNGNAYKYKAGDVITITYTATINKDAVTEVGKNKAELQYGTDPDDLAKTTPRVVKTWSSQIVADKYKKVTDASDTSKKLAGAKFVLKRIVTENGTDYAEYYKGTYDPATKDGKPNTDPAALTKVEWVRAADKDSNVKLSVDGDGNTVAKVTAADGDKEITVTVTDATGAATFAGLENGTYYLVEVEAPAGYNLLKDPVTAIVNAVVDETSETDALLTGTGYTTRTVTAQIANDDGSFLPSTGGTGTVLIYTAGTALVLTAAVWFIAKKRAGTRKRQK